MAFAVNWMLRSVIIGLLAGTFTYGLMMLAGSLDASYISVTGQLYSYSPPGTTFQTDDGAFSGGLFIMEAAGICLMAFTAGMTATLISRQSEKGLRTGMTPALIAGCIQALAINANVLLTWLHSVQVFSAGGTMYGRPFEPVIFPMLLVVMGAYTLACLGISVTGGRVASRQGKNSKADKDEGE